MDCSTSSSSSEQTTETRQSEHYKEKNVEDDSGCNWDIEIAEFVVESFICLFPESRDGRRRVRQDTRGEYYALSMEHVC